jgi:hypothetical protein
METSIIHSLFAIFIFILFLSIGYLLLSDFSIKIDNDKTIENIS